MRMEARFLWTTLVGIALWIGAVPARSGATWTPAGCTPQFFGGAPKQPFPGFAPGMQFQPKAPTQPQSQTAPFPQGWKPQGGPPSPVGWPPPPTPQTVGAKAQPLVRAKNLNPESTPTAGQQPVTLSLPSPAALGIAPAAQLPGTTVELVDWNAARARLNQLGAVSFNVNRLVSGAYRMVVTLPTANPSQNYLVEVVAESEAVAVATALDRAESWARK